MSDVHSVCIYFRWFRSNISKLLCMYSGIVQLFWQYLAFFQTYLLYIVSFVCSWLRHWCNIITALVFQHCAALGTFLWLFGFYCVWLRTGISGFWFRFTPAVFMLLFLGSLLWCVTKTKFRKVSFAVVCESRRALISTYHTCSTWYLVGSNINVFTVAVVNSMLSIM